jgi:SAM-dependent methyltransferase
MALAHPDASIVAFDISRASLAYGSRMAARFGVTSVRFLHGDLLELGDEGEFAIVACVGVLHHLTDPMAGWRRLVPLVAPDGVMKIGLYSTAARTAVAAARAFARERRFADTADGIRACRQAILSLPPQHPARGVTAFTDFFSISGCRDLVMHVQEQTFTIPALARALDALKLQFLGFQLPQPSQVRFAAEHGSAALLDLDAWDRFEQAHPETFAAMYQFWCAPR